MKKIVLSCLLGLVSMVYAIEKPSDNASKKEIAMYLLKSTYTAKTYGDVEKAFAPYSEVKVGDPKFYEQVNKLINQMNYALSIVKNNDGYAKWGGIKPKKKFDLYEEHIMNWDGGKWNAFIQWKMFPKLDAGGTMMFSKEDGKTKVYIRKRMY